MLTLYFAPGTCALASLIALEESGDEGKHLLRPRAIAREQDPAAELDQRRDDRRRVVPVHPAAERA